MATTTEHRTLQIVRDILAAPDAATGFESLARAARAETPASELARSLVNRAGGLEPLSALTTDPLPDEAFDWTGIDPADRAVVSEVLALAEAACDRWLDVEYRTIARRLLARIAARDPKPLRRTKRPRRLAAGLVLAILQGNGEVGARARYRAGDVAAWFDVSSVSDAAHTLLRHSGLRPPYDGVPGWYARPSLPTTELLHSRARERLRRDRDAAVRIIEEEERRRAGRRAMVELGHGRIQVTATPADVARVDKGTTASGQIMVMVGLCPVQPEPELDVYALTVPEAHRLHQLLEQALAGRAPGLAARDHGWPSPGLGEW